MTMREKIIDSATEIFTTMVMMDIRALDEQVETIDPFSDSITGLIGLAGSYKGIVAIHLPHQVACAITSNFLGMDITDINEDVEDAVGEIANMLGGNIKTVLSDKGSDVDLSLPSTISGADYGFQIQKNAERTIVKFSAEKGDFFIELQIEK